MFSFDFLDFSSSLPLQRLGANDISDLFMKGSKMKLIFVAVTSLAIACSAASAQYVGPNGAPASVKQLLDSGYDHDFVVLRGHITGRVAYDDLYQFNDGTANVLLKIDRKNWPFNLRIDDKTRVEIAGKFDREFMGFSKVKVTSIRIAE